MRMVKMQKKRRVWTRIALPLVVKLPNSMWWWFPDVTAGMMVKVCQYENLISEKDTRPSQVKKMLMDGPNIRSELGTSGISHQRVSSLTDRHVGPEVSVVVVQAKARIEVHP
ncbi:hypothetical protein QYF36_018304 [Acer negundo]|nr:hypothetical protein QYF36_018304 [Acer negundo]